MILPDAWDGIGRARRIDTIAATPRAARVTVAGWTDAQLDLPYREGGWSSRQVIHHLADSHTQAYTRIKLALTEDRPIVKTIDQASWATLADTSLSVNPSLDLLDALHTRWVALLRSLTESDFSREMLHPENGPTSIDALVAYYAWHGPHHVAQIRSLAERKSWRPSS